MKICNLGCIGPEGVTIALDEIVCLVGPNNSGKSTVLRAYEAAVEGTKLTEDEFHSAAGGVESATVELWVHIPEGAENIDAKWKESKDGLLLVRSLWTWAEPNKAPVRKTWDPALGDYAEDGKASGLDTVFNSRLPKPFRIGSLENPEEEHKRLLKLVLDPIAESLKGLVEADGSPFLAKLKDLKDEANKPLESFKEQLASHTKRMNRSYQRVFGSASVDLRVSLGDLGVDLAAALNASSTLRVSEPSGGGDWSRQGTGSQRALFWTMLEIRSDLKRHADHKARLAVEIDKLVKGIAGLEKKHDVAKPDKKPGLAAEIAERRAELNAKREEAKGAVPAKDGFLPGHMLLIDEPETALHPSAIRGAREHLYSLAQESGWQVILTTHHPAFVDPEKDHTTVVRLHRGKEFSTPKVYRSDDMKFSPTEKEQLSSLLAFDLNFAEMFFGGTAIIVEGDTEYAAFTAILNSDPGAYPVDSRPVIVRARGKATIPLIVRMLAHFKMDMAVLHDVDSPFTQKGDATNPAFTTNENIAKAIAIARASGVKVLHRCSCPNFETHHGMSLPTKDKPLSAYRRVQSDPAVKASVRAILDELKAMSEDGPHAATKDGSIYVKMLEQWIEASGVSDACYKGT